MTRRKAKDIALSILARWHLRTIGKENLAKAAAHTADDVIAATALAGGRRPLLRALSRPVRI